MKVPETKATVYSICADGILNVKDRMGEKVRRTSLSFYKTPPLTASLNRDTAGPVNGGTK
jgi:hypothetical protein